MSSTVLFEEVRDLVSLNKIEEALEALLAYTKEVDDYADFEDVIRTNQASYAQTHLDALKNTLSDDEKKRANSRIRQTILEVVSELEKLAPTPASTQQQDSRVGIPSEPQAMEAAATAPRMAPVPLAASGQDKIFISIILGVLVLSVIAFFVFLIMENYPVGGAFFTSAAGTCFIYLNNKKQNLRALQAAAN